MRVLIRWDLSNIALRVTAASRMRGPALRPDPTFRRLLDPFKDVKLRPLNSSVRFLTVRSVAERSGPF